MAEDTASIEARRLFNEFQAQSRLRIESSLKLVLLMSGSMLTLSIGALLSRSAPYIPSELLEVLKWGWALLFFSIGSSMLLLASMIGATYHMGVRWRRHLQQPATSTAFIVTWTWLRALNAVLGAVALLSFLVAIVLMSHVAIGVAGATHTLPSRVVSSTDERAESHTSAVATDSEAKDRAEKFALDRKLVGFNGDLAHYTLALAVLGGLQLAALGLQVLFLRLAFKEARRSGDIARDAMVAGERAFVFAVALNSYWELDGTTQTYSWRFRPLWRNSGDTPTRNMLMHSECVVRETRLPAGFDFAYATAETGTALLAPHMDASGGLAPRPPHPAVTAQDIVGAQQGQKYVYIWGWARYSDVFPDTPVHLTRFCWLITCLGNPLTHDPAEETKKITFSWILNSEGNCADDECQ